MNDIERLKLEKIAKLENCDGEMFYYETRRWGPIAVAIKQQPDGSWRGLWSIFGVAQQMRAKSEWTREAFIGGLIGCASEFCVEANKRQLLGAGGFLHG